VSFAAILLFSIYTSCHPAELVDGLKSRNSRQALWDDLDDLDSEDSNYEGQDLKQSEDPNYDKLDP
jgi:hypothetical protein